MGQTAAHRPKVTVANDNPAYVRLSRRIGAVLVDGFVIALALFAVIAVVSMLPIQPPLDLVLVGLITGSIEPLLVAYVGGSVGHYLYGLRVRRASSDQTLGVLQSYLRLLVKLPLGIASLVTVLTSRRHQAIHDLACGSIVVYRKPEEQPKSYLLAERTDDKDNYVYPSKMRRVLFILLYYILLFGLFTTALLFLLSDGCFSGGRCSRYESATEMICSVLFNLGLFVIAWLGWRGSLPGCRRKVAKHTD